MKVGVIGTGYVGLVAGACFAENGNGVVCMDINENRVNSLKQGEVPIYEPGLSDLVRRNQQKERLSFTTSIADTVQCSEVIFIAVGTPQDEDGSADLTHVVKVAEAIGDHMNGSKIVVNKSTVPVGTAALVKQTIESRTHHPVHVVSNPEFLKEGAAIEDFLKPDRVVIGTSDETSAAVLKELYGPFVRTGNPILVMDVASAELTKYAANTMLAARVSFMNEIARLCEVVNADVKHVRVGMGTDKRIGMSFLFSGIGYGGSCFPKDVRALIQAAAERGLELKIPVAVEEANQIQKQVLPRKVLDHLGADLTGKVIAIWGLAFKPRTDDVREAPALTVCEELIAAGAALQAYDPEAMSTFEAQMGSSSSIIFTRTNYDALKGADALVICTEWNEFRNPNYQRMKELMKRPLVFDGRNILSRRELKRHEFEYFPIGRPPL